MNESIWKIILSGFISLSSSITVNSETKLELKIEKEPVILTENVDNSIPVTEKEEAVKEVDESERLISYFSNENEREKANDTHILFAGDTHFLWGVKELQEKENSFYPLEDIAETTEKVNFFVLNLETVMSPVYPGLEGKSYIFNSDIENSEVLRKAGVDLVVLGNNHSMDLDEKGLLETQDVLRKAGLPSIGAGENSLRSHAAYKTTINGIKFAFLSFNEIGPSIIYSKRNKPGISDLRYAIQSVRNVRNSVDHIIVNLHWGKEYITAPLKYQQIIARRLIDSGASVIIGHHPHIPQGVEKYKNGIIYYSLGNFLFGSVTPMQTNNIMAEIVFNNENKRLKEAQIIPITGRFAETGHKIEKLDRNTASALWQELILQIEDLHTPESMPKLLIDEDGTGRIIIEQDS